ncbi:hypothetical protein [Frisingicoccus sp.]|uniref:hypothetical protein n=1 Tax=Frisingicoccus sp. TaxID=1918627 RepID=UPI003AB871C7
MENLLKELKKENKERERRLNIADRKILTDMMGYMKAKKVCEYDVEQVRRTIIRNTLKSYNRKKNLEILSGGDYQAYCDRLCADMRGASSKELILTRGVTVILAVALMYGVRLIDVILGGGNFMKEPVEMSLGYLLGTLAVLLGTLVIYAYVQKILKGNSKTMTTAQGLGIGVILILIVAAAYAGVYFLSDVHLFYMVWWIPAVVLLAVYVVFRILYIQHVNMLAKES